MASATISSEVRLPHYDTIGLTHPESVCVRVRKCVKCTSEQTVAVGLNTEMRTPRYQCYVT